VTAAAGRLAADWRTGPLAVRSFRLLAGGQFASTIGDFCYTVALPWLVLSAHGGAILLGAVLACYGVPRTVLTVLQKWVSPGLLGRVMGTLMLCSFGSFPLSVAVSGVLVHHFGPAPFFPVAGSLIAVAILGGVTQREFRAFGATGDDSSQAAAPKAAEGSRK